MNDFDYDVMQKKRIANSARHRKNGSKSRKCPMSTDHMTQKQWKERNGKILSINMNAPIDWKSFKTMPEDIQKEYIEKLINTYGVTAKAAGEMFGCTGTTLSNHFRELGLGSVFKRGVVMSSDQKSAWNNFLHPEENLQNEQDGTGEEIEAAEEENAKIGMPIYPVAACASAERPMTLERFELRFGGEIDFAELCNSLRFMIGEGRNATLQIYCTFSKDRDNMMQNTEGEILPF